MSLSDINSDETATRLHAFARLLATPLYVPLAIGQSTDDPAKPRIFEADDHPLVLGFLSVEAMADLVTDATEFVELPGAELIAAMAGQGLNLGVEFGAEDAVQLNAASIDWLAENAPNLPPAEPLPAKPPMPEAEADDLPPILRNLRPYQ